MDDPGPFMVSDTIAPYGDLIQGSGSKRDNGIYMYSIFREAH